MFTTEAAEFFLRHLYSAETDLGDKWRIQHEKIPSGYLNFLVDPYRVAIAYSQPLLEQRVLDSIQEDYTCINCKTEGKGPCVALAEEAVELIEALAIVSKIDSWPTQWKIWDRLLKISTSLPWDIWTDPTYLLTDQVRVDQARGIDQSLRKTKFVAMHLLGKLYEEIEQQRREIRALKQQTGYDPDDEKVKKEEDD